LWCAAALNLRIKSGIVKPPFWYYHTRMKTITFKADERLDNWLEKEAKTLRVSKSQILRDTVEMRMKQLKGKSCYDLSKDLCGSFRSGVPDLATNKKYMKNFGK
jgi:hypothetical protein